MLNELKIPILFLKFLTILIIMFHEKCTCLEMPVKRIIFLHVVLIT